MWTFEIKPFTFLVVLVMMMTRAVFICSAVVHEPNPCEKLRQDMKVQVTNLSNETWKNSGRVPKPTQTRKCPKNFFCLAEKVLESITQEPERSTFSELTNTLKQYNKKICSTQHCKLKTDQTYYLRSFLEDVMTCLNYTLLRKPKK